MKKIIMQLLWLLLLSSCTIDYANSNKEAIDVRQTNLYKTAYYTSPFVLAGLGYYQNIFKFSNNETENRIAGAVTGAFIGMLGSYLTDRTICKEFTISKEYSNYSYTKFDKRWEKAYLKNSNSVRPKEHSNYYLEIDELVEKKFQYFGWQDYWAYFDDRDFISFSFTKNQVGDYGNSGIIESYNLDGNGGVSLGLQYGDNPIALTLNTFFETFELSKSNNNVYSYYFGISTDMNYVAELTSFIDFYNGIGYQYSYFYDPIDKQDLPKINSLYYRTSIYIRPLIDYYFHINYKISVYDFSKTFKNWNSIEIGVSYVL